MARSGSADAIDHSLAVLEHARGLKKLKTSTTVPTKIQEFDSLSSTRLTNITMMSALNNSTNVRDVEKCLSIFDTLDFKNSSSYNIVFKALYLYSSNATDNALVYHRYSSLLSELESLKSIRLSEVTYSSIFHGLVNSSRIVNDKDTFQLCLQYYRRMREKDGLRVPSGDIVLLKFLFAFHDDTRTNTVKYDHTESDYKSQSFG